VILTPGLRSTAATAITRTNYVRGERPWQGERQGRKEWFHFSISSGEIDAIVNFSIFSPRPDASGSSVRDCRVIVAVRAPEWTGELIEFSSEDVIARPGSHLVTMGPNLMRFHEGAYEVSVRTPDGRLQLDLTIEPRAVPAQANNATLPPDGVVHWLLVPRMAARGTIRIDERTVQLEGAPTYHDHNWGAFGWGADFAWEWGYALTELHLPWSLVFVRLSDRGHRTDLARSLFLWEGERQLRFFRDEQLEVTHEGFLRAERPLRLPGVLHLLAPGAASDVPRQVVVTAREGRDHLTCRYTAHSLLQIGVPNDAGLGATIINEVSGTMEVTGEIYGRSLDFQGRAFFEFLDG
jgi:hypothetical protein